MPSENWDFNNLQNPYIILMIHGSNGASQNRSSLQLFVEMTQDAVLITDGDGRCLQANQAACNLLQRSQSEIQGRSLHTLIRPEFSIAQVQASLQSQNYFEGISWISDSDGTEQEIHCAVVIHQPKQLVWLLRLPVQPTERGTPQQLHSQFETLLHSLDGIIWEFDLKTELFTYISPQAEKILGYPRHRWLTEPRFWLNHLHVDDQANAWNYCLQCTQQLQNHQFEYRMLTADGRIVWMQDIVTVVVKDNKPIQLRGLMLDISDRKQVEQRLQQSEATKQALIDAVPDLLLWMRHDGTYLKFINRSTLRVLNADKITEGSTIYDLLPPDVAEERMFYVEQALVTGQAQRYEYRLSIDGVVCYEEAQIVPVTQNQVLIMVRDITDRKQMELAVRTSEAKLNSILNSTIASIRSFRLFPNHRWEYEYFSAGCFELLGFSAEEMVLNKDSWRSRVHPEDWESILIPLFDEFIAERNCRVEYRVYHRDGTLRWIADAYTSQRIGEGDCWLVTAVATDITDRKQTEVALEQSRQRYASLAAAAPVGIFRTNRSGECLYVNFPWCEIAGFTPEQAAGRGWVRAIHPEDREIVATTWYRSVQENLPFQMEYRFQHCNGHLTWVYGQAVAERDENGWIKGYVGTVTDITALKRAEEALWQRVERDRLTAQITQQIRQSLDLKQVLTTTVTEVRKFLEADRVVICRFIPDWGSNVLVESVLSPWSAMLGIDLQLPCFDPGTVKPYQQGYISRINDISSAELPESLKQLMVTFQIQASLVVSILFEGKLWGLLCVQQCRSTRHWQSWEVDLLTQLSNQVAIAIHQAELYQQVQRMNTELEQKVQERTADLQRSLDFEALLRRISDNVRDSLDESQILQSVVRELAVELNLSFCNTALYRNLGNVALSAKLELKGEYSTLPEFSGFLLPIEHFSPIYDQLLQGSSIQFCVKTGNQSAPWVTVLVCPIIDLQDVIGDILLMRDKEDAFSQQEVRLVQQVTNQCAIALRQSRLYQAAQQQVEELGRLNHLKDDFLSTVSHELRTPMSNIKMSAEMLEMVLEERGIFTEDSRAVQYFQVLSGECQRETNLINDLLDLSRLEADADPLMPMQINLQDWIPAIAEPFEQKTRNQGQHLQLDLAPNLPTLVTDLKYLERILSELLQNACKYTPADEWIIVSAQRADFSEAADLLQISVTNTGVEILPEECDRIFDKFYRIPNSDPWKHGGTGLGLALVKRLSERLRGTVQVTSNSSQTCFTLRLPMNVWHR